MRTLLEPAEILIVYEVLAQNSSYIYTCHISFKMIIDNTRKWNVDDHANLGGISL